MNENKKLLFNEIVFILKDKLKKNNFRNLNDIFPNIKSKLGDIELVYSYVNNSDGECEFVNHFITHDVYISLSGYYSSYDGYDFDGFEYIEVKPKEKIIIVYEQ